MVDSLGLLSSSTCRYIYIYIYICIRVMTVRKPHGPDIKVETCGQKGGHNGDTEAQKPQPEPVVLGGL